MLKKFAVYSFVAFVSAKAYNVLENKMLNDTKYLQRMVQYKRTQQANELVIASLNEAKKFVAQQDYESAMEYYMYIYKIMGCDWNYMMLHVDDTKMRKMLEERKQECTGSE